MFPKKGEKSSDGEIAFRMLAANGIWPLPANVVDGYRPPLLPILVPLSLSYNVSDVLRHPPDPFTVTCSEILSLA